MTIDLLTLLKVSWILLLWISSGEAQTVPQNQCPSYFSYERDNNGIYYGRLEFPNDLSGNYDLGVNVSLATLIGNRVSEKS